MNVSPLKGSRYPSWGSGLRPGAQGLGPWAGPRACAPRHINQTEQRPPSIDIDFATMCQRNIDNDRTRTIKIVRVVASGSATEQTTNQ